MEDVMVFKHVNWTQSYVCSCTSPSKLPIVIFLLKQSCKTHLYILIFGCAFVIVDIIRRSFEEPVVLRNCWFDLKDILLFLENSR